MLVDLILNLAYLGLAYQTFKGLQKLKDFEEKIKGGAIVGKGLKEEQKENDDLQVRILMKW